MMTTYEFAKRHNLSQLNDEIITAIPELATGSDRMAKHRIEGDGKIVRITVPETITKPQLKSIVDRHTPNGNYGVEARPTLAEFLAMPDDDKWEMVYALRYPEPTPE